jgi:hypothetical protein
MKVLHTDRQQYMRGTRHRSEKRPAAATREIGEEKAVENQGTQ